MNNPDLISVVRAQEEQINRLRGLHEQPPVNYEEKYKKALKEISGIIQANKQLKQQLDKLRHNRNLEVENYTHIQKEEFQKAYDKLLREKNQLTVTNETLQLQRQNLQYQIESMHSHIALLKNKQMNISQEKQAIQQKYREDEVVPNKQRDILKEKENQYLKKIEGYEEHHTKLSRANRKLQERIIELENKLLSNDKNWKNIIEQKEIEDRDTKHKTKQQHMEECANLRKDTNRLRANNNQLQIRLQSIEATQNPLKIERDQEDRELIRTLHTLKAEIQPMRIEIAELNYMNSHDREQIQREKANLQIKVMELQADVQKYSQNIKNLQQKLIQSNKKIIDCQDQSRLLKKLQQQNRILGGRVIVLQSKDITLKNRTGEELEERMLEFQTRIEMLLSQKENIANIKNISIHQMIALKSYIMELDAKIRTLAHQNQYSVRKYKSYKDKYLLATRETKQYEFLINSHKTKIQGYDKLVIKLQTQLERMMKINEHELANFNVDNGQTDVYKKKYLALEDKLTLQEKYALQELETVKLHYQTKIVDIAIRAEEIKSLKETVELYKTKNDELVRAFNNKENQLLETMLSTGPKIINNQTQSNNFNKQSKQLINDLYDTIHTNDDKIFKLQNQIRTQEDKYFSRIRNLERDNEDLKNDLNRIKSGTNQEDRVSELQVQLKKYKMKCFEMQNRQLRPQMTINQPDQYKKTNELQSKLSMLQMDYQEQGMKLTSEVNIRKRLESQLQTQITNNETQYQELSQKNLETAKKIQSIKTQLHQKDEEIRRLTLLSNTQKINISSQEQSKFNILNMEKENLIEDNTKLNEKCFRLETRIRQLQDQLHLNNFTVTPTPNNSQIESLKAELQFKENQIIELKKNNALLRNKIANSEMATESDKSQSYYTMMIEQKDNNLRRLNQQLMEIKDIAESVYGKDIQINSLKSENIKLKSQMDDLNEVIMRFNNDIKRIKATQFQYSNQLQNAESALRDRDMMISRIRSDLLHFEQQNDRLKNELSYLKQSYQKMQYNILQKADQISELQLALQNTKSRMNQNRNWQINEQIVEKEQKINSLTFELTSLRNSNERIKNDNEQLQRQLDKLKIELSNLRNDKYRITHELDDANQNVVLKEQHLNRLISELNNLKSNQDHIYDSEQVISQLRIEINQLKNKLSNSEEQTYQKEGNLTKIKHQINYLKQSLSEIEEQLQLKNQNLLRQNIQIANLKSQYNDNQFDDRQKVISRLKLELQNLKRNYNMLETEIELKEKQWNQINQELYKAKGTVTMFEDQIDSKNNNIARLTNQVVILKGEIQRLNQEITQKSQQINRLNDQIFKIKLESSSTTKENTVQWDSQNFMLKSKIKNLEDQIEEKEHMIGKLRMQKSNVVSEIPLQSENYDLKSRIRYLQKDIADKQNQIIRLKQQQNSSEWDFEIFNLKKKLEMLSNQISYKDEQISRLTHSSNKTHVQNLENRIQILEGQNQNKNNQIKQLQLRLMTGLNNTSTEDQNQYIAELISKIELLQRLKTELQTQNYQKASQYDRQIKKTTQAEQRLRQQLQSLQQQLRIRNTKLMEPIVHPNLSSVDLNNLNDMKYGLSLYQNQVDRLGKVVNEFQQQVSSLRMQIASYLNQQDRIQENMITMVLMFTEIEALREQICLKKVQITDIRKNLIAIASGDVNHQKISEYMSKYQEEQRTQQKKQVKNYERIQQQQISLQSKTVKLLVRQSDVQKIDHMSLEKMIHRADEDEKIRNQQSIQMRPSGSQQKIQSISPEQQWREVQNSTQHQMHNTVQINNSSRPIQINPHGNVQPTVVGNMQIAPQLQRNVQVISRSPSITQVQPRHTNIHIGPIPTGPQIRQQFAPQPHPIVINHPARPQFHH